MNIPIITCLCNPGLRARHWRQMGDVIGFDITPNSGSSLRKVLRLELTSYMVKLEAISVAATQEHALELTLKGMKAEWEHVKFSTVAYRLTKQSVLGHHNEFLYYYTFCLVICAQKYALIISVPLKIGRS